MKEFPQIFAFYSFKGGVGRSMAVLNLAYALAVKGRHVLVLDMDLEAPGLSGFLSRKAEIPGFARFDMVNLVGWASKASLPLDPLSFPPLSDYVVSTPPKKLESIPRQFSELGRLDLIPVEDRDYYNRLASLSMGSLDQDDLVRIGSVLRVWLKNLRFPIEVPDYYGPDCERTASYDYVLVDSRTGITETGGLCIGPLSDQLVVLTGLNDQNVEGTRTFLKEVGVLNNHDQPDYEPKPKPCLIVASLVPAGEVQKKLDRLKELEKALGRAPVRLSYHPQLALEETIFIRDHRDEYLAGEYEQLAHHVLTMAEDEVDPDLPGSMLKLSHSSCEFREALSNLIRSAGVAGLERWLSYFLSVKDFADIANETDYILWDRACRVLSSGDLPFRLMVFNNWANLLFQWNLHTPDPELATLRRNAAISRYEQVLQADESSPTQKALALYNRGVGYGQQGEPEKAIADYTAVVQMSGAPSDQKARTLVNRGVMYVHRDEPEKAIADYTAVIQTPNAPADQKAKALVNRGVMYVQGDEPEKAIADYTALIQIPDIPADQKALALVNRGMMYVHREDPEKAIADYTAVIQMPDAPADQKAKALIGRGWLMFLQGRFEKANDDAEQAISLSPNDPLAHANLAIAMLVLGQVGDALATYDIALVLADIKNLDEMKKGLREAIEKHVQLPGAEEAMARLEARRQVLSQGCSDNNSGTTPQEPVGSR